MEPKTITFALKIMIFAHFRPTLANWVQHNGHKLHIFGPGRVFVTAASFLNIAAKTGIVNLSEIYYYEILANEHHHVSP